MEFEKKLKLVSTILICSLFSQSTVGFAQGRNGRRNSSQISTRSNSAESPSHGISIITSEALERLSTECQLGEPPSTSFGDRCSEAVIDVISSYPFVAIEVVFFITWWVYNKLSPNPFDPAPVYAGNGVTTTVAEDNFGTLDVMNQKIITQGQDWRAGLQEKVSQQSLRLVEAFRNYKLDPTQVYKEVLELSVKNSKELLAYLEKHQISPLKLPVDLEKQNLSLQNTDWQKHWDQVILALEKPANGSERTTDFMSRYLGSPEYLIGLTSFLSGWIIPNTIIADSIDPFPYPYLNTLLCALTTLEFSLLNRVMKRRGEKVQIRDATTELLGVKHLNQMMAVAEGEPLVADSVATDIPYLDEILSNDGRQFSRLTESVHLANKAIASYPSICGLSIVIFAWVIYNLFSSNPIDPGPTFPFLNISCAIVQEFGTAFEVNSQNLSNADEVALTRFHNHLHAMTLELTRFFLLGEGSSPENLKAVISKIQSTLEKQTLEIGSILQKYGLPQEAVGDLSKIEAFYKNEAAQSKSNQDIPTEFVSTYLRTWGYFWFMNVMTASYMTFNSISPYAFDPYPFVAFNIGLTILITIVEPFVIRNMLRQNAIGVMRRGKHYFGDAKKLRKLIEAAEAPANP